MSFTIKDLKYEEFLPSLMRKCWDEHRSSQRDELNDEFSLIPFSSSFYGAVLFADISGFTRLSSSLQAEELKKYINSYFSTVIGVIDSYNGDVIKFCGDALLVVWPVDVDASISIKEAAVTIACKCALNLVNKSLAPPAKKGSEKSKNDDFRFHCGVSSGIIHGYVVGTSDRLEFLVSGYPITLAGKAASEAGRGQVCVSPEAYSMAQSSFSSVVQPFGNHLLTQLIFCHPDCYRCAHLSGLYRLMLPTVTSSATKNSGDVYSHSFSRTPPILSPRCLGSEEAKATSNVPRNKSFDESVFAATVRKLRRGSEGYRVSPLLIPRAHTSSPAPEISPMPLSPLGDIDDEDHSISLQINGALSSNGRLLMDQDLNTSFTSLPIKQKASPVTKDSVSLLSKLSGSIFSSLYKANKESRVSPTINLEEEVTEDTEELSRLKHIDIQKTEAEVSGFLRPYHLRTQGADSKCAYKHLHSDAAERFYGLFVGSMVQVALGSDMVEFLAEIKVVTTVFIDIIGAGDDFASGACRHPQKAILVILDALKRCGGFLRQYLVDDKGCVAICAFGVPGYCHIDDSIRAVEAAVAISRGLQQARLNCRIGIAVGSVYCGLVGSSDRCEYAMMGSSVNLAARLMGKCTVGKIHVSEAVRSDAKSHFQFEEHRAVKMKGFKLPVPVFEPTGRYSGNQSTFKFNVKSLDSERLVARLAELKSLTAAFNQFRSSTSIITAMTPPCNIADNFQAHVVDGGSGMGKSAVLKDIRQQAVQFGINVNSVVATPPSYMKVTQYDTMAQLLVSIFMTTSSGGSVGTKHGGLKGTTMDPHHDVDGCPRMSSRSLVLAKGGGVDTVEQGIIANWFADNVTEYDELSVTISSNIKSSVTKSSGVGKDDNSTSRDEDTGLEEPTPPLYSCETGTDSLNGSPPVSPKSKQNNSSRSLSIGAADEVCTVAVNDARCLLNKFMPVVFAPHSSITKLPSRTRRKLRDSLILFVLRRSAEKRKMLLIIYSLQFCDVDSLRVIHKFTKIRLNNCFLLCGLNSTTGLNPLPVSSPAALSKHNLVDVSATVQHKDPLEKLQDLCVVHTPKPFGYDETVTLTKELLGEAFLEKNPSILDERLIQKMLRRTNGVPGLLVALLTNLRDTDADGETEDAIGDRILNMCIVSAVDTELLDPTEKFVLKLCSVIGASFLASDATLLASKVQSSQHCINMRECLDSLVTKTFLVCVPLITFPSTGSSVATTTDTTAVEEDCKYQFSTCLLHENIYNMMLKNQKKKTHASYAAILERRRHVDIDGIDLVIHHYMNSSNVSKQYEYLVAALEGARGLKDGVRVMGYLTQLIKVWTKGSVRDMIAACCTIETDHHSSAINEKKDSVIKYDVGDTTENDALPPPADPRAIFASHVIPARKEKLPAYLGSEGVWLSSKDLITRYVDTRGEPQWLPCWIGERSVILFSQGQFLEAHNEALLALHVCGLLHSHMFVGGSVKGTVFSPTALKHLTLPVLETISALFVELAAINVMFGGDNNAYYIALSDVVDKHARDAYSDTLWTCERSFYIFSTHELKDVMRNFCLNNVHHRRKMLRAAVEVARGLVGTSKARSSSSYDFDEDHSPPAEYLDASISVDGAHHNHNHLQCEMPSFGTMTSTGGKVGDVDSSLLLQIVVASGEGRFAVANAAFSLLRTQFNSSYWSVFGKYTSLLIAWVCFLCGKAARAGALVNHLLEYSLAANQMTLYRWTSELGLLLIIMYGKFENEELVRVLDEKIVEMINVTCRDKLSPCCCAALSLALALDNKESSWARALPLARYAVEKLSHRSGSTLISGIFLFIAGYASVLLMQHDNVRMNCLGGTAKSRHREMSPRLFYNSHLVAEKSLKAITRMALPNFQPCLKLLVDALSIKLIGATKYGTHQRSDASFDAPLIASLKKNEGTTVSYKYPEFTFGLSFLQLEQLNYIKSRGVYFRSPINILALEYMVMESFYDLHCIPEMFTRFPGPDSVLSYLITKEMTPIIDSDLNAEHVVSNISKPTN